MTRQERSLAEILGMAIARTTERDESCAEIRDESSLAVVAAALSGRGGKVAKMLAEASLIAFREQGSERPRTVRDRLEFLVADKRPIAALIYTEKSSVQWHLEPEIVKKAIQDANKKIELI